jgi:pimeloyl-ACP methyl ester carboxylesterase
MSEHRITTPHGTVALVDYGGDGPSVLLLHGGGRTLADWELVRRHLRGRRVVAADFRWHGFSSDEGDVSLEANADDAEAIIDALGLNNPAIAGHSLGGMVAAVYATRHPDCPGVVNLDGHGRGTPDQYEGISAEQLEAFFQEQREALQREETPEATTGDDAWRDAFVAEAAAAMGEMGIAPSVADALAVRSFVRADDGTWHLRPNPHHVTLLLPILESLRLFDVYRAVQCPLLIYHCTRIGPVLPGAEEVMSAYQRGLARDLEALAAERPNVMVRTLDATHMMIFEIPEEVARDILSLTP